MEKSQELANTSFQTLQENNRKSNIKYFDTNALCQKKIGSVFIILKKI